MTKELPVTDWPPRWLKDKDELLLTKNTHQLAELVRSVWNAHTLRSQAVKRLTITEEMFAAEFRLETVFEELFMRSI